MRQGWKNFMAVLAVGFAVGCTYLALQTSGGESTAWTFAALASWNVAFNDTLKALGYRV